MQPTIAWLLAVALLGPAACSDDTTAGWDGGGTDVVRHDGPDYPDSPGCDEGGGPSGEDTFALPEGALRSVSIGESWTSGQGDEVMPPGWPPIVGGHIESRRPGSTLANLACAGWSASQLLTEGCDGAPPPIRGVESSGANIVFVSIGGNEIADWQYEEPSRVGDYDAIAYETALRDLHIRIATTGARVVQVEVLDITRLPVAGNWTADKRATIDSRIRAANTLIAEIVAERGGCLVPLHDVDALYNPSNFIGDGLHMNHDGYAIIGEAVWRSLEAEIR